MLDTTTGPGVDVAEGAIKLALLAMMQEVCRTADLEIEWGYVKRIAIGR
jgi:hypothetical protein